MTTKNIQDVVAERVDKSVQEIINHIKSDPDGYTWNGRFNNTLTQLAKKVEAGEQERICKNLDEMWSALYGAYLNNQDLRELIKNVVTTPPTSDVIEK